MHEYKKVYFTNWRRINTITVSNMTFSQRALQQLTHLRKVFLNATDGLNDYWTSEELLALYDETFAERIGWKWNFVLEDLERRGWQLPEGTLLDWGCGTGIASRKVLQRPIATTIRTVSLFDRSSLSINFASRKLTHGFPHLNIIQGDLQDATTVLISHVLNELTDQHLSDLLHRLKQATAILWVEPSQKSIASRLLKVREMLRKEFHLIAPCPHQASCGMLAPENARHWCHHFAMPPAEAFTESKWAKLSAALNIDLRDLSLSYLVLDKRAVLPLPPHAKRVIGNIRLYKASASMLLCDEHGVRNTELYKRDLPEVFKAIKKGAMPSLFAAEVERGCMTVFNPL